MRFDGSQQVNRAPLRIAIMILGLLIAGVAYAAGADLWEIIKSAIW